MINPPLITPKFIDVIHQRVKSMDESIWITVYEWAVIKDILEDHVSPKDLTTQSASD